MGIVLVICCCTALARREEMYYIGWEKFIIHQCALITCKFFHMRHIDVLIHIEDFGDTRRD
jgi:hypothetical protein